MQTSKLPIGVLFSDLIYSQILSHVPTSRLLFNPRSKTFKVLVRRSLSKLDGASHSHFWRNKGDQSRMCCQLEQIFPQASDVLV